MARADIGGFAVPLRFACSTKMFGKDIDIGDMAAAQAPCFLNPNAQP
jgi:hypothetical protein